jgi:hypothetical protein
MVVTAALAESGMVARFLNLPKAGQASAALSADTGGAFNLQGIGQVREVAVAPSGVTVVLAPAGSAQQVAAMAMAARGNPPAPVDTGCDKKPEWHHIATVTNEVSTLRGGPWTPRFKPLFDKAGLSMNNTANKVLVKGHKGPHPEEYHDIVLTTLTEATRGCPSTQTCRELLVAALQELASKVATRGTVLHRLATRGCE